MPQLFTVLGIYGVGFGIWSVPTALFVGPHLLVASFGHIIVGTLCLLIARGLSGKRVWAWWAGALLSFVISLLALAALAQSLLERDVAGVAFFSITTIFLLIVFITSMSVRAKYLRHT